MGKGYGSGAWDIRNALDPLAIVVPGQTKAARMERNAANDARVAADKAAQTLEGHSGDSEDPEALKRTGRASLITSSSRGVLTQGETSGRKLFGV